ncbi:MAG TPA: hypothetical protein VHM91_19860, partial [Verrucomicrobiales bacterium]|nr:hypothetical protein [Verrucomicrobiales bacterium]
MRKKKARRLKPFVSATVTWFWRLAALSLLVAGLFCSLLQTYNFWHCLRARRWVSRTCTILKVEV